jgi:peroxiredoxin
LSAAAPFGYGDLTHPPLSRSRSVFARRLSLALCVLALPAPSLAGKYNAKLDVGDAAPVWRNLPGVDGRTHSLADLADRKVVVVVFTCNSCGYATDYEARINAFAKQFATGREARAALFAINVNKGEEDALPAMRERATKQGFTFPYLYDESQAIAREFGAVYTPTFFVLDAQRRVVFMGPFDDATDPKNVQVKYVEAAMQAALAGKLPEVTEKPSIGCRVRYDDGRRGREREPGTLKPE